MNYDISAAPILTDVEQAIQDAIFDLKYDNACIIHDNPNCEQTNKRIKMNNLQIEKYEKMKNML